jgi:hypothetical protein
MLALFEMARSRAAVLAAVQGLLPGSAEQPLEPGKWSARQMVLHLAFWDAEYLAALDDALNGTDPPWAYYTAVQDAAHNATGLAPLDHLNWDEALRLLHTRRAALLEAVEVLPAEPETRWAEPNALGLLLRAIGRHDRHHADIIKRWRSRSGV